MHVHKVVASLAILTAVASCGFGSGTWYLGEWKCWGGVYQINEASALTVGDGTWSFVLTDSDPYGGKEASGTWEIADGELAISNPEGIPDEEKPSPRSPEDYEVAVPLSGAPEVGTDLKESSLIFRSESEKYEKTMKVSAEVSDESDDVTVVLNVWEPDQPENVPPETYTCQKA